MNKKLQAFERIIEQRSFLFLSGRMCNKTEMVRKQLEQRQKDIKCVEKSLKALEIIKNKSIDVHSFMLGMNINTYETFIKSGIKYGWFRDEPTEEEYELLKEVLND